MTITAATIILIFCFAIGGILAITVAITNADWFFRSAGVKALTGKLSRPFLRLVYALIGIAIIALVGFMVSTLLVNQ